MRERIDSIVEDAVSTARTCQAEDFVVEIFSIRPGRASRVAETYFLHAEICFGLLRAGFKAPIYVAPGTLKKWSCGNGRAEKAEVREGLEERLGMTLHKDHNAVDAVGLALIGLDRLRWKSGLWEPPTPWHATRIAALSRMV